MKFQPTNYPTREALVDALIDSCESLIDVAGGGRLPFRIAPDCIIEAIQSAPHVSPCLARLAVQRGLLTFLMDRDDIHPECLVAAICELHGAVRQGQRQPLSERDVLRLAQSPVWLAAIPTAFPDAHRVVNVLARRGSTIEEWRDRTDIALCSVALLIDSAASPRERTWALEQVDRVLQIPILTTLQFSADLVRAAEVWRVGISRFDLVYQGCVLTDEAWVDRLLAEEPPIGLLFRAHLPGNAVRLVARPQNLVLASTYLARFVLPDPRCIGWFVECWLANRERDAHEITELFTVPVVLECLAHGGTHLNADAREQLVRLLKRGALPR